MTDWIRLDTVKLNSPRQEEISGVRVNVLLSPHDVPTAVRSTFDAQSGRCIIEFRYIDDEPWELQRKEDGVFLRLGRYSSRLYGVEIARSRLLSAKDVELHVSAPHFLDQTIRDAAAPQSRLHQSLRNLEVARKALDETAPRLFHSLVSAAER